jgi:sulfofructose kinase
MIVTGLGQCSLDSLALVDTFPQVNTKKEVLQLHEQGGGPVATALVALARLGIRCNFYGTTGDDIAGKTIRRSLTDEGVDISGLLERSGNISQLAYIVIEKETARRTIFWKRPSGKALRPDELGADFLTGSDFLLLDGLMYEASFFAAERAKAMGIPVMLDAGSARQGLLDIARLSDYVVASEEFARGLGWDLAPEVLRQKREKLGIKALTITLGERGSITVSGDNVFEIPAFSVKALDTTGAGDVFHGGYIYGLLQGWELRRVVIFAAALAAMKCRTIGGRAGIPGLSEVISFLETRGIPFAR